MTSKTCTLSYMLINDLGPSDYTIRCIRTQHVPSGRIETETMEIGQVLEMNNDNPLININFPMGVNALVRIIELIQAKKNEATPAFA